MHFSRPELREQMRYIDNSIEAFEATIAKNSVVKTLGSMHARLAAQVSNMTPVLHKDGYVSLDGMTEETIPVIALKPEQTAKLSAGIMKQTEKQRISTVSWLGSLSPEGDTNITDLLASIDEVYENRSLEFIAGANRGAAVIGAVAVIRSNDIASNFKRITPETIIRFYARPSLLLTMHPHMRRLEPDITGHELVHVQQKIDNPITVFGSQSDVDMHALRQELEAYHVGRLIRVSISSNDAIVSNLRDRNANHSLYLQYIVDSYRENYGPRVPGDLYAPSQELLEKINSIGFGNPIDGRIDFSSILNSGMPE